MQYSLRPYQTAAVESLRAAVRRGQKSLVLHAPTGSGKTLISTELIRAAVEKGKLCLFLAPRRELVYQCADKLEAFGLRHGIIMAQEMPDSMADVQVACVPTLHARAMRRKRMALPQADLVILDEAHLHLAPSYQAIAQHYLDSGAVVIGLTATPARGDGRGLGELYDEIVPTVPVAELVDLGFLVPQTYFSPSIPDLAGIKIVRGDYHEGQLEERMDRPKLVGDIVTNWARLASERQTVVFASGVQHSIHLRDEFRRLGVTAEHIDGKTPLDERQDILDRVARYEVQVLCNCMVCTFGWDSPSVSCCVLARPTRSLVMYLQMAGRVLRPHQGKDGALVLDHSGVVQALGFVDDEHEWSLDGKERIQDREKSSPKKPEPITCPQCRATFKCASECPSCGWKPPERKGEAVEVEDGDLYEIGRNGKRKKRVYTLEEKQRWYSELAGYAAGKGYKPGWISHKYRAKFGVWPVKVSRVAKEPSVEVLAWVRSQNIRHAKRREGLKRMEDITNERKGNDLQRSDEREVARHLAEVRDQPGVPEGPARPVSTVRRQGSLSL